MDPRHAPFGGIYMGAPEWLRAQQMQGYEMPAPEYRSPPGSGVARAIENFLTGAAGPAAALGRGAWDIMSTPQRVYQGDISPTGPEASRFALSAVPVLGAYMTAADLGTDVGGGLRRNNVGLTSAALASSPYEADEKLIVDLRAERRRIEASSTVGSRTKRESLNSIDRQIEEAVRALGERKGKDFDEARRKQSEEARIQREAKILTDAAEVKKKEGERPFRERQPEISDALNKGGLLAAALIGIRGGTRHQLVENAQARRIDDLTAKEALAREAARRGEPGGWQGLSTAQDQLRAQQGVYARVAPQYGKTALAGAAAAGVPPSVPELIDMGMPAGTAAKTNAVKQLTDGTYWGQKAAFGAAGVGLAEAGLFGGAHMVRKRVPDQSRAIALEMDKPTNAAGLAKEAAIAEKAGQDFLKLRLAGEKARLAGEKAQLAAAEAQHRSGAHTGGAPPILDLGAVQPGLSAAQNVPPALPRLPPPAAPSQSPLPPPPQAGLTIPDTITGQKTRVNKSYGEQTSPDMQAYVLGKADAGIAPDTLNKAQVARDLSAVPNRANAALNNLIEIARANKLDISDPRVLRSLIAELNAMPAYRNKRGTGNSLFSAPMIPFGSPNLGEIY